MAGLPSGTVTFLFTDLEGSTRLWEEHADDMAPALARHDELLRGAIAARGGYVFSTAGDAFAAAFGDAAAAAAAAVDAQRALQAEDWPGAVELRVRMGIHTGETVERDGDYFGPTLNRGARVMAAAHGNQVLVTAASAEGLDAGVAGAQLLDLGEHRLRDLEGTERLFQLVAEGLAAEFPPVQSLDASISTLPPQRSSFVGRDDEIARIRALLHGSRLVTLTGTGGCGKTRLAIEVAAREQATHPDGTFFVDLSRVADDTGVAGAFAAGLDFVPEVDVPVDHQVRERIGTKHVLVVVDNCEHLLDEVAGELDELLASCPGAHVLATSREVLDVEGERTYRVPSLALDADDGRPASVRLFLERAAETGAELAAADDASIADICRRLDGLPLAIELAAARTGVLTPAQILGRLDDRFALLTGGRRRTRGRQQTLEAAIDWSYDLLEPDEQDALRRLSVMPGAFDLDLAAAVLATGDASALDMLDALVARSLVHTERAEDATRLRYRLLETIRAYAYEHLLAAGDVEETRDRHAAHVADRLESVHPLPFTLYPDHDALADDAIAALEWARVQDETSLGARLACAATPIFVGRGLVPAGRVWLEWGAQADDPVLAGKTLACRSGLEMIAGDTAQQVRSAGLALKLLGEHAAPWRARAHILRAIILTSVDPDAAAHELAMARAALVTSDDASSDAGFLEFEEVGLHLWRGEHEAGLEIAARSRARPDLDETIAVLVESGYLMVLVFLAREAEIEAHLHDSRAETRRDAWCERARRGEQWFMTYEVIRAVAVACLGDHERARRDLAAAVALLSADRLPGVDTDFLGAFAWVCWFAGEHDRAATLLDDTFWLARSPVTMTLLMEVLDRLDHRTGADALPWRIAEINRRYRELRDVIERENRPRRMLDDELARLGLSPAAP